jgi:hypothetical protein
MLVLGVTDIEYAFGCRRQFLLSWNYSSMKPAAPLWIGSTVHAGLEGYYRAKMYNQTAEVQISEVSAGGEALEKSINDSFKEFQATNYLWQDFRMDFEGHADLARAILANYFEYSVEHPLEGKILSVETPIKIKLFDAEHLGSVYLSGKIDLLLERDDGLYVIDHKTSGSRMSTEGLDVDDQLTGYSYLVQKKYGKIPRQVLYNVLIKNIPTAPRLLKDGSLSKDISQKTTLALYQRAIEERGFNPDDYVGILNMLADTGWNNFFQRDGSIRNQEELKSYYTRTVTRAHEITRILTNPAKNAWPSPSTYQCSWCPFLGVCKSIDDGGDYEAILNAHFLPFDHHHDHNK